MRCLEMLEIEQYIAALGRLYGVVHKDLVKKIYNQQNEHEIDDFDLKKIMEEKERTPTLKFIFIEGEYFCYDGVAESDEELNQFIARQKRLPFYVPKKAELLQYTDDWYFEDNEAMQVLLDYLTIHFFKGKEGKAEELLTEIQVSSESGLDVWWIEHSFDFFRFNLQKRKDKEIVMDLIKEMINQTRRPMFNGYTGNELFNMTGKKKFLC